MAIKFRVFLLLLFVCFKFVRRCIVGIARCCQTLACVIKSRNNNKRKKKGYHLNCANHFVFYLMGNFHYYRHCVHFSYFNFFLCFIMIIILYRVFNFAILLDMPGVMLNFSCVQLCHCVVVIFLETLLFHSDGVFLWIEIWLSMFHY